jgi:hypothetical protein
MTTPTPVYASPDTSPDRSVPSRVRVRAGLALTLVGLIGFLIGAKPEFFGLDRSPVVGFVQITVFLVGLAFICMGGYIALVAFWRNGDRSIAADIGSRLVATGYVIAVFSGMADIFGMGTQPFPGVPHFGPWQAVGVQVGQAVIAVGLLLLIPFRRQPVTQNEQAA